MTAYELKRLYEEKRPDGNFFSSDTLRFFGELMSDMKVQKGTEIYTDYHGKPHECYVLSTLQRNNPSGVKRKLFFFDIETLEPYTR